MYFSYFVTFHGDSLSRISEMDLNKVSKIVKETPGLQKAKLYTPQTVQDLYIDGGPSPTFTMQLYFKDLEILEQAIGRKGHLQILAEADSLASLSEANITHQVMLTRSYPVLDRSFQLREGCLPCTYLVHYPGPANNLNEWLTYYIVHHPPIMKLFPGIREIEIYTRVDWIDAMPWQRVNYMQRNKVVFDSTFSLNEALQSTVRQEMHADLENFPSFKGGNLHYPLATRTIFGEKSEWT